MGRKRKVDLTELADLATTEKDDGTYPTHAEMAKHFNVTRAAVTRAIKKVPPALLDARDITKFREKRADAFAEIQRMILMHITPDKLSKASLQQLGTLLGIMYDKEALEQGRATSHVAVVNQNISKIDPETIKQLKDVIASETRAKLKHARAENQSN